MENEFSDCFNDLIEQSIAQLKTAWETKLQAMKSCMEQL